MNDKIYDNYYAMAPQNDTVDVDGMIAQVEENLESDSNSTWKNLLDPNQGVGRISDVSDLNDRAENIAHFKNFVKELEQMDENQQKAEATKTLGHLQPGKSAGIGVAANALGSVLGMVAGSGGGGGGSGK